MFEIYPLQNSVTSLNGKKPVRFDIRKLSSLDKDRTFNFNPVSKKYSYVADGEELVYEFTQKGSGTIGMRAFTDVLEERQYFFEAKDINNNVLGLYRDANMYLVVDVNGSTYKSNLKFETNKWQTVMLSFKDAIGSSSMAGEYLDLRVYLDGKTWTKTVKTSVVYENFTISLGRQFNDVLISMSLGSYWYSNPFCGQIEMLSMRPAYCELTTLNTLNEELKGLTKVSEFDEFGLLKKVDVHECSKSILSNTYDYKKRSRNSKYISKQISKETIKCGSNTYARNYETDVLGNITKVSDNTFGNHEYKYDPRGFLIEADGERYSYDQNGNIIKKGNFTLTYDSTIKDRLISFNGIKIDYDSENPLNPTKYGSNSYTFEGRRLVKLSLSGTSYDYIYNDQGLRVKKVDNKGNIWYYTYDGEKLITEISNKGRLDFLYDENGNLYGFVKDKTEKYLYIRDFSQNILGIADINGKIIVKYGYDVWGLTKKLEDSSTSNIGDLNPFRFKGYYYDNESAMYYCKTRYYVPLWGRWLNADCPKNLVVTNVSIINLYGYCSNNPINFRDENGTFSWGDIWNGIKNFFKDTIGGFIETTKNFITQSVDYLFAGYEAGIKGSVVAGDDTKPISFYISGPSEWWKFWEIEIGVKVNFGDFHASVGVGLTGFDASFGYKNTSVDIRVGLDKIGFGFSHESNGIILYEQYYINTIPTALAVAAIVVCVLAPQAIPVIGPAISGIALAF